MIKTDYGHFGISLHFEAPESVFGMYTLIPYVCVCVCVLLFCYVFRFPESVLVFLLLCLSVCMCESENDTVQVVLSIQLPFGLICYGLMSNELY